MGFCGIIEKNGHENDSEGLNVGKELKEKKDEDWEGKLFGCCIKGIDNSFWYFLGHLIEIGIGIGIRGN